MAKKIQLQDANGNVLHPLTLGECVAMDNGENLDTLMSKSQMFTPTITQDKGMFKVGTGVDVDYSANVKDGAYESLVFKGKSLVNLLDYSFPSRTNWYDNAGANSHIRTGQSIDMLKPNTDYLMWFEGETTIVQILALSSIFTKAYFELTGKSLVKVRTVNEELPTNFTIHFKSSVGGSLTDNEKASVKLMLIEYVEGMENWDIPYFTGICDSKMPILRNVGKNLLTREYTLNGATLVEETNEYVMTKGSGNIAGGLVFAPNLIPNKTYSFSVTAKTNRTDDGAIRVYNDTRKEYINVYLAGLTTQAQKVGGVFTVPSTHQMGDEFKIWIGKNTAYDLETTFTIYKDWQLEESLSITTHEDHKSNILRTSEEIVLREVNGVQDTYNALTGEYVQRIGEIVLDGSENEWEDWSETSFVLRGNYFSDAVEHTATTAPRLKCNNMVAGEGETPRTVRYYRSPTVLWTMVGKNNGETLDQFKTWLSQNPTTIQYILAEPVTTIVKPSTMTPFAYQNGHVIVESGFEGQSLLPEIEYSVVTGRTGQVTQNTKVLRKQEQQIIGLEELLLTQVVQMEYERTLLQFDYELQMMMLG